MTSGETSASNVISGYVSGEQIALSAVPSGSAFVWGLAIPSGSTAARSSLDSTDAASTTFVPDVPGEYVVTCTVDASTAYVIRCSVAASAAAAATGAIRFLPLADSIVPTPSTGATMFYSSTASAMSFKLSDGSVKRVTFS